MTHQSSNQGTLKQGSIQSKRASRSSSALCNPAYPPQVAAQQ
jgi:hypothetical protein